MPREFFGQRAEGVCMRIRSNLKSSLFAGLGLVAPLAVTLFVLRLLVSWAFGLMTPLVRGTRLAQYTFDNLLAAQGS
jgi:uncharacterized membrane protein